MSALKIVTTIALGVMLAAVFTLLIMVLRGRRRRCHIYRCREPGEERVYVCTRHGRDPRLPNLEDMN